MNKFRIASTLIFYLMVNISYSQNDTTTIQNSIRNLSFMTGDWEGVGWTSTRDGKVFSDVKEKVEYKLDSSILIVEGLGSKTDTISKEVKVVHNAFGVIFFDSLNNSLNIRAYKEGGGVATSKIKFIDEKVIEWSMDIPNGSQVRFTVDFNADGKWIEIGEFSRDGLNWVDFLGMELKK